MDHCLIVGLFCCIAVGPLWVLGKPLSLLPDCAEVQDFSFSLASEFLTKRWRP